MSKGKVLIEKIKETAGIRTTRNPHAVNNVNVSQGPRTGNNASMTKRNEFKAAKEERAPLADVIEKAYGARAQKDYVTKELEPISSNTRAKFKR